MKKIVLASAIALASVAHAADLDSCHILTAGEDKKVQCAETKVEGKLNQLNSIANSIKAEIQSLRKEDGSDASERGARIQKLNLVLTGIETEIREVLVNTKTFLSGLVNKKEDGSDSSERAARIARVQALINTVEDKLESKANQIIALARSAKQQDILKEMANSSQGGGD